MELASRIRAFVALRLSAETDRALVNLIEELRAPGDGISWARQSSLHLTLRFLGAAVDSRLIPALIDRLRKLAIETASFDVGALGIGAFPDLARPRVIWAGLNGDALIPLARRVENAAVQSGFPPEQRPYSPHLTLGRVKSLKGWRVLRPKLEGAIERDFGRSTITAMTLYESKTLPSGAEYREIARFEFAASRE